MREEIRDGRMLRQLVARRTERRRVDLEPGCAYEVLTRQMVEELASDLGEIKGRINALFSVVIGAILIEVIFRLVGWG